MVQRRTSPGCCIEVRSGEEVVITHWDDETGLVRADDAVSTTFLCGDYRPAGTRASYWPQLQDSKDFWHRGVLPQPVRIRQGDFSEYRIALAWNEATFQIEVVESLNGYSFDPTTKVSLQEVQRIVVSADDYEPINPVDWPPLPRPQAERVQSDVPWDFESD
jgi:hypothetical protein